MELNPNNKVVQQAHDNWHKITALVMIKLGVNQIEMTLEDVKKLNAGNINIVLDAREESKTGKFYIRLVDDATALRIAVEEGGMLHQQ